MTDSYCLSFTSKVSDADKKDPKLSRSSCTITGLLDLEEVIGLEGVEVPLLRPDIPFGLL
jgi:hypothetical protein